MNSSLSLWVWMVVVAILIILAAGVFYLLRGLISNLLLYKREQKRTRIDLFEADSADESDRDD